MNKADFILNAINPSRKGKEHFIYHIDVGVDGSQTIIKKEPLPWLDKDIEIDFLDSPDDGSEPQGVYTSLGEVYKDIDKFDLGILYMTTGHKHEPILSEGETT